MRDLVKLLALSGLASLAACASESDIDNVEAAAENAAEAIEAEANNIAREAENATAAAVDELANQAEALENQIDAVDLINTNRGDGAEGNNQ